MDLGPRLLSHGSRKKGRRRGGGEAFPRSVPADPCPCESGVRENGRARAATSMPSTDEPGHCRLGMMGWAKSCRTTRGMLAQRNRPSGQREATVRLLRLPTVGALSRPGRGCSDLSSCFCGRDGRDFKHHEALTRESDCGEERGQKIQTPEPPNRELEPVFLSHRPAPPPPSDGVDEHGCVSLFAPIVVWRSRVGLAREESRHGGGVEDVEGGEGASRTVDLRDLAGTWPVVERAADGGDRMALH